MERELKLNKQVRSNKFINNSRFKERSREPSFKNCRDMLYIL